MKFLSFFLEQQGTISLPTPQCPTIETKLAIKENYTVKYHDEKEISLKQQALIQMTSGAIAGMIETISMHPLDVIKTRLQLQKRAIARTAHPKYYHGVLDCIKKIYKQEGVHAFGKGIVPPLLIETPRRAVKFFMVEQYAELFSFNGQKTILSYYLGGMAAGITEAPFVTPFEVIKVNMQAQSTLNYTPSTREVALYMFKKHGMGINGLLRGLTATIFRGGSYSAIYYGFYFSAKNIKTTTDEPMYDLIRDMVIGSLGGVLGSIVNTPFDVAKSRIQGPQNGRKRYVFTLPTMKRIYEKEGFDALFTGLMPKMLRLSVGGAIMFVSYDRIKDFLTVFV